MMWCVMSPASVVVVALSINSLPLAGVPVIHQPIRSASFESHQRARVSNTLSIPYAHDNFD